MEKIKQNKNRKVFSKNITAFLIAGLLSLAAACCILAPSGTKASAELSDNLNAESHNTIAVGSYAVTEPRRVTPTDFTIDFPNLMTYINDSTLRNLTFPFELLYKKNASDNYSVVFTKTLQMSDQSWFEDLCGLRMSIEHAFKNLPTPFASGYWLYSWRYEGEESGSGGSWDTFSYTLTSEYLLCIAPVILPDDPVKEGYTFIGWFYDEACTRPYNGEQIFEDTVLYAGFKINSYTVTFDSAGGSAVAAKTVNWNTAISDTDLPTPERIGHIFLGWFLNDGTQYTNQPIKSDTTLTAKWEIKIFTVTFKVDGAEYKTAQVPYGSSLAKAMSKANIQNYMVKDIVSGIRVSKHSVITEDTFVLITELTGWEKFGDYMGQNKWVTFAAIGLILALGGALAIAIVVAKKRG